MDGPDEVGLGDRPPLVIGDRDQGHFAKSDIERLEIGKVLSAVKSSHRAICHLGKKRKMKLVNVEMQNVEFFRELTHPVEHQHVIGDRVPTNKALLPSQRKVAPNRRRLRETTA
jgi:hypothetical protein